MLNSLAFVRDRKLGHTFSSREKERKTNGQKGIFYITDRRTDGRRGKLVDK